ncbi:hypothetical protein MAR_037157, partial [Mya arenaria]
SSTVNISVLQRAEHIGDHGESLTRVSYFVSAANALVYPSITLAPSAEKLAANISSTLSFYAEAYMGKSMAKESLYSVLVESGSVADVHSALNASWEKLYNDASIDITVVGSETFIGLYGIELMNQYYSVVLNGSKVEPNFIVEPLGWKIDQELKQT